MVRAWRSPHAGQGALPEAAVVADDHCMMLSERTVTPRGVRGAVYSSIVFGLVGALAYVVSLTVAPAIPAVRQPVAAPVPREQIERGAVLAAIGDCSVCHMGSAERSFAGGRGVPTPFGIVYATNISPDPETGIGAWPLDAFRRAMRDGISRDGHFLYPVLPYPHFTRANDDDIAALYAYLETRTPIREPARPNALPFPFDLRPLLAFWDLLFLDRTPWQPDPAQSPEWNRGEYLAEAIGHCGACHTPRNPLGAERTSRRYAGGEAEGWDAPSLAGETSAPRIWTAGALTAYLRTGFAREHGAAAGPMAPVTHLLGTVPESDVRSIAVYFASVLSQQRPGAAEPAPLAVDDPQAAPIFQGACASCHGADAPMTLRGNPPLSVATSLHAQSPRNAIAAILQGIDGREGRPGPFMPGFGNTLTDAQVARLTAYVRARYAGRKPWQDLEQAVRSVRDEAGNQKDGGS